MRTLYASSILNHGSHGASSSTIETSVTADIAYCNHALTRTSSSCAINSQRAATPVPQQPDEPTFDSGLTTEAGTGDGSGPGGSDEDGMEALESLYLPLPGHDYPAGGACQCVRRHDSSLPILIFLYTCVQALMRAYPHTQPSYTNVHPSSHSLQYSLTPNP